MSSFDSERPKVDCDETIELVLITFFGGVQSKQNKGCFRVSCLETEQNITKTKKKSTKKLTGAELLVVLESQGRDESGAQSDECPEEGHTDSTITEIIKNSKGLSVLRYQFRIIPVE